MIKHPYTAGFGPFQTAPFNDALGSFFSPMSDFQDRLLPSSPDAERTIIGGSLLNNDMVPEILESLSAGEFYVPRYRAIFSATASLFEAGDPINPVTIMGALRASGSAHGVTAPDIGATYEGLPHFTNPGPYIKRIQDAAVRRNLIKAAAKITEDAYDETEPADEIVERAEGEIFRLAEKRVTGSFVPLEALVDESLADAEQGPGKDGLSGISTGFTELDNMTGGLQPGEATIVAGRSSMGKTSMALSVAQNVALLGKRVAIFSLEMSRRALADRLLCSLARVDLHRYRRRFLHQKEWTQLAEARGKMFDGLIQIDDSRGLTMLQATAKARRLMSTQPFDLAVFDYLELIDAPKAESEQARVSKIAKAHKNFALELEIPSIMLAQVNRSPESRTDKRPQMSDLRMSGDIENVADLILLLYREEYYFKTEENRGQAELIVAKQRNGPTGTIKLAFLKEWAKFEDLYRD